MTKKGKINIKKNCFSTSFQFCNFLCLFRKWLNLDDRFRTLVNLKKHEQRRNIIILEIHHYDNKSIMYVVHIINNIRGSVFYI